MAIDMKTSIRMHHCIRCPSRHLDGKLEVGTGEKSENNLKKSGRMSNLLVYFPTIIQFISY
jgi:hypothetical protein